MARSRPARASVDCPTCDAFEGEACRDDRGRFRGPHRIRFELMLAKAEHGGRLPDRVYDDVMETGSFTG